MAERIARCQVRYLSDLLAMVWVDGVAVVAAAVEHLEVTPILVHGLLL